MNKVKLNPYCADCVFSVQSLSKRNMIEVICSLISFNAISMLV